MEGFRTAARQPDSSSPTAEYAPIKKKGRQLGGLIGIRSYQTQLPFTDESFLKKRRSIVTMSPVPS